MAIAYKSHSRGTIMQTNFLWGGAISAGQTEGNRNHVKSKMSNFDMLPMDNRRLKLVYKDDDNNIFNTYNDDHHPSDLGIDFYHTYIQDIKLLHDLGINAFRFSISWTRLFPTGEEKTPNQDGMEFYRNIFKELKKYNIEPVVTLSHFEIPLDLVTKYGGWSNRKVIDLFLHYTDVVMKEFSRYVKYWIPFSELNMILHIPFIGGGLTFTKTDNILQREYQVGHYQLLANSLVIKHGHKINPRI
jgi:Beta-glucosidase/6-phospho-beta-glucosidase/beta-galactosidase